MSNEEQDSCMYPHDLYMHPPPHYHFLHEPSYPIHEPSIPKADHTQVRSGPRPLAYTSAQGLASTTFIAAHGLASSLAPALFALVPSWPSLSAPLHHLTLPPSLGRMFALLVQARELKAAAFTQLVSGPDDFPPGAGPYGAAVGTVQRQRTCWQRCADVPAQRAR